MTEPQRKRTHTVDAVQTWQHAGWIGQTGRLYRLDENPAPTERGSFAPLWELIENEPPILDDERR
jgi:hypothetical protein